MNKLILSVMVLLGLTALSEGIQSEAKVKNVLARKLSPEEYQEYLASRESIKIEKPGTKTGVISVVNCQSKASDEIIHSSVSNFAARTKYDVQVKPGVFAFPTPTIIGQASLFVVDDKNLPQLLSAPENRWAMVNVFGLMSGKGAKTPFFNARVQKEITRGLLLLCGAQDSNYPNSIMGAITDAEDLDKFVDCRFPIDIQRRIVPYLSALGITPAKIVSYRKACQEGWAPNPVNRYQREIWDEVHAIPDKPITIEFDPKKDK